ncbi:MAG: hypothetical protein AVDCRST_MAG69-814, partial [uncultured Solirubrobacteraceae bacterium]
GRRRPLRRMGAGVVGARSGRLRGRLRSRRLLRGPAHATAADRARRPRCSRRATLGGVPRRPGQPRRRAPVGRRVRRRAARGARHPHAGARGPASDAPDAALPRRGLRPDRRRAPGARPGLPRPLRGRGPARSAPPLGLGGGAGADAAARLRAAPSL